ncbi:MAG: hypothetical protein JNM75_10210 [Rhodospirillales bacterium]|nr:hypothetical protein [Rhodospirillales bacterium]
MPLLALMLAMFLTQASAWAGAAPGANAGIDAFFGTYRGHAPAGADTRAAPRDLSVTIEPAADSGFVVSWTTIARGAEGRETAKSYTIAFRPTQRPGVYRSAMRANVFGERVPLDPFSGDPFFWARLSGSTLSVFALIISDDGGYDLQIYDRTLGENGLDLVFSRWIDRQQVAEVRAQLTRVAD